jgi:hypothetical protein
MVEYQISLKDPPQDLAERIEVFLKEKEIPILRRLQQQLKSIDLRKYVHAIGKTEDGLFIRIHVDDAGTARPEEIIKELGLLERVIKIKKTKTFIERR